MRLPSDDSSWWRLLRVRHFVLGLALAAAWWSFEAALHAWVFDGVPFWVAFLGEHDPNEIWMRGLVASLVFGTTLAASTYVEGVRRERERTETLRQMARGLAELGEVVREESRVGALPGMLGTLTTREDDVGRVARIIAEISILVDRRIGELRAFQRVTRAVSSGLTLDEVLERTYEAFRGILPYDRMGVALLDEEEGSARMQWSRAEYAPLVLRAPYQARLAGSSLQRILETGQPRILNDLEAYLEAKPGSDSTRRIVAEGIRSSLTCPLVLQERPVGFIFFSSRRKQAYNPLHVTSFQVVSDELAVAIDRARLYERLVDAQRRSRDLLLNVMPERVAERLMAGQQEVVERLDPVGILFADIVDFTGLATGLPPVRLGRFLGEVFTALDELRREFPAIEKVKTIGDEYMVAAACWREPAALAQLGTFALRLDPLGRRLRRPDGRPLRFRVGIHAGPVVAGVLGQEKFAYDMWGDTVNLASRLESGAAPGQILVSRPVHAAFSDRFLLEPATPVLVTGRRHIDAWSLLPASS